MFWFLCCCIDAHIPVLCLFLFAQPSPSAFEKLLSLLFSAMFKITVDGANDFQGHWDTYKALKSGIAEKMEVKIEDIAFTDVVDNVATLVVGTKHYNDKDGNTHTVVITQL